MKIFKTSGVIAVLLITATLGGGRPSLGAVVGTESLLAKMLEQTAAMLREADRKLGLAEQGIAQEADNVAQLDRDVDEGADPDKVLDELVKVSKRLDADAKSVQEVADSVAGIRTRLVRIIRRISTAETGVLAGMAASQLRAADALLDRTDDANRAIALVRDSIEVLRSKVTNR